MSITTVVSSQTIREHVLPCVSGVTLAPHSLIYMRPLRSLLKVTVTHYREPHQGQGHTVKFHRLLYKPMLLKGQSVHLETR